MLELTSSARTISSEMFSDSKLVIVCGLPSSKTLKSAGVSPLTNRPSPSVTTAVSWTTSTSTASLCFTPFVWTVAAARPPACSAVALIVCSLRRSPASQSHWNGSRVSVQTFFPSAKKTSSLTPLAAAAGSMTATSRNSPLANPSSTGDVIRTLSGGCAERTAPATIAIVMSSRRCGMFGPQGCRPFDDVAGRSAPPAVCAAM